MVLDHCRNLLESFKGILRVTVNQDRENFLDMTRKIFLVIDVLDQFQFLMQFLLVLVLLEKLINQLVVLGLNAWLGRDRFERSLGFRLSFVAHFNLNIFFNTLL